mgnify:CR=1 FL=1
MKTTVDQIFEMIESGRIDDIKAAKELFISDEKKKIENAYKRGYLEREKIGKFRKQFRSLCQCPACFQAVQPS